MSRATQTIFLAATIAVLTAATHAGERNVDGIMDNSFLVEEAYNQEAGVVQHIWTGFYSVKRLAGDDDKALELGFTQEWPVGSHKHQFSFTVPYSFIETGGQSDDGVGDVLLNYRYQAVFDERALRAFSPRFSLVLPTGGEDFGDETFGYQINLPFSTAIGDSWFAHLNAGTTWLPNAGSSNEGDLVHANLGGSIIYAPTRDLHALVEWVGNWEDDGDDHQFVSVISPGVRKAFNFANDSQLVVGVAAPIGLTHAGPDFGVFLYCSYEHFFRREK